MRTRSFVVVGLAAALLIGASGLAAAAQAPQPDENAVVSPLAISVLSEPRVVKGTDGLQHPRL